MCDGLAPWGIVSQSRRMWFGSGCSRIAGAKPGEILKPNVRIQRTDAAGGFGPADENVGSPTDGPKTPAVAGPLQ